MIKAALQSVFSTSPSVFSTSPSVFSTNLQRLTPCNKERPSARELAEAEGFQVEDHHAVTADGFVLVLHRILDPNKSTGGGSNGEHRPAVLLMHGLMQDSEALLCGGRGHALGLRLAVAGFDVFLGNARGNRYSHKHLRLSPSESNEYWNYSIDELARYDTPAMVDCVLEVSGQSQLCYIGFSQGSAQAFAALSSIPRLLEKVFLFVALSPAVGSNNRKDSVLLSLVHANLRVMNLVFGKGRVLSFAMTLQRLLSRELFAWVVDVAMCFLFSWNCTQVSPRRKLQVYPHLYSYSSVKCVVHWFQTMFFGRLSMFADSSTDQYFPVTYDVSRVSCPVAIVHGGRDQFVAAKTLKSTLPNVVMLIREEEYEHLDTMWADSAKYSVFPEVEALVRRLFNGNQQRICRRPSLEQHSLTTMVEDIG